MGCAAGPGAGAPGAPGGLVWPGLGEPGCGQSCVCVNQGRGQQMGSGKWEAPGIA